jgi:hypothetical protein
LGNKAGSKKSGKEFGPKTAFLDGLDLLHNLGLATHGINRHDTALDGQQL